MTQYAVLTQDPNFAQVLNWVTSNNLEYEVHLNRTRFHVPNTVLQTEFLLRFCHCTHQVDENSL